MMVSQIFLTLGKLFRRVITVDAMILDDQLRAKFRNRQHHPAEDTQVRALSVDLDQVHGRQIVHEHVERDSGNPDAHAHSFGVLRRGHERAAAITESRIRGVTVELEHAGTVPRGDAPQCHVLKLVGHQVQPQLRRRLRVGLHRVHSAAGFRSAHRVVADVRAHVNEDQAGTEVATDVIVDGVAWGVHLMVDGQGILGALAVYPQQAVRGLGDVLGIAARDRERHFPRGHYFGPLHGTHYTGIRSHKHAVWLVQVFATRLVEPCTVRVPAAVNV